MTFEEKAKQMKQETGIDFKTCYKAIELFNGNYVKAIKHVMHS